VGGIYREAIDIDRASHIPPHLQVAAYYRAQIERGELAPHARLPSIATLVQEWGIARATAAKALKVLTDAGLAEVVPGMGTFVTGP
jgi:DNA-binding GntR family transcriptional regulator